MRRCANLDKFIRTLRDTPPFHPARERCHPNRPKPEPESSRSCAARSGGEVHILGCPQPAGAGKPRRTGRRQGRRTGLQTRLGFARRDGLRTKHPTPGGASLARLAPNSGTPWRRVTTSFGKAGGAVSPVPPGVGWQQGVMGMQAHDWRWDRGRDLVADHALWHLLMTQESSRTRSWGGC